MSISTNIALDAVFQKSDPFLKEPMTIVLLISVLPHDRDESQSLFVVAFSSLAEFILLTHMTHMFYDS